MAHYTVLLDFDPEVGVYTVTVPALPGCVTEGDTTEEALEMARDAIEGYLTSLANHGEALPIEHPRLIVAGVDVKLPSPALVPA